MMNIKEKKALVKIVDSILEGIDSCTSEQRQLLEIIISNNVQKAFEIGSKEIAL